MAGGSARAAGQRAAPRVGIALGAGGARGLAHLGVLRTLVRAGIRIDAVVGTSIGALVGAAFAAGQLEVLERRLRRIDLAEVMRMFDPVWPRSGLLSGARAAERLAGLVGDWRIEELPIAFAAVAVDLITGDEVVIREGSVIDAVRASISIPGMFVPFDRDSRLLVDGALRNPVPVSALGKLNVDVRLAVNLHARPVREIGVRGSPLRLWQTGGVTGRVLEAVEGRIERLRARRRAQSPRASDQASGPNLFEILTASMTILEHELARHRLAVEPVDVVLTPRVDGIRSFEFHKARSAIQSGVRETEGRLPEIRRALKRRTRSRNRRARRRPRGLAS